MCYRQPLQHKQHVTTVLRVTRFIICYIIVLLKICFIVVFREQFLLLAPMTTYLKDLTQSIGRYGGLSWQN